MEGYESNKKDSVFRNATDRDDLRNSTVLKNYIEDNYTSEPPKLKEIVSDIPHLSKLAENIHNLLKTADEVPLSQENANLCELGVRHLLNEVKTMKETDKQADKSLGKARKLVDYAALLAQNPSDITLAKLQIVELQRENQELTERLKDIKADVQSIQDDNDRINDEIVKKNNEMTRKDNNHKDELSRMKYEYEKLDNERQTAVDKSKLYEEEIAKLKKLLDESRDEAEVSSRELDAAKERLSQKNELITKLRTDIKKKEFELQEFNIKREQEKEAASSEFLTQSRIIEDKNEAAVKKLTKHILAQAKEIELLREANVKATEAMEKQNNLLDKYEDEMTVLMNDDSKEQLLTSRDINDHLQEDLETTHEELARTTDELTELRDIVEQSISNLAPAYAITQDQLPDICRELSGTRIDPQTSKVLRTLNAIAEGLAKFVRKLMRDGVADLEFLKPNPIKVDRTTRSDILNNLAEIREFLDTISYSSAEEDKAITYLLNPEEKFNFDEESDNSFSAVLVEILKRYREFTLGMMNELDTVREVLPAFDCKDYELPAAVAEYIKQLQPVFQQLLIVIGSTLHFHGDITDIFSCLCRYIEESSDMITYLDENIRPLINYGGKIVDIAPHIEEVLMEYKEIVEGEGRASSEELRESIIAADRDRASYERQIDQLKDNIHKNDHLNLTLQKQLEKVASDLQTANNHIEDLNAQNSESDKTNENLSLQNNTNKEALYLLQQHNARLEATLKERTETYEKRLQQALEKERSLQEDALNRDKRRYEEQQLLLEKQIKVLTNKLREEKEKVSNTVKLYNEQSEQFQREIRRRNQEVSDLQTSCETLAEDKEKQKIIDRLKSKLTDAKAKNKELVAEVTRLSGTSTQCMSRSISCSPKASPYTSPRASPKASPRGSPGKDESKFVEQLGDILKVFLQTDISWTRNKVIKTVDALVQRVSVLEKSKTSSKPNQWTQWADNLLHQTKPKYAGGITDLEMRQQIGDLTIAAGNRTKLIDMIQMLRDEKKILETTNKLDKAEGSANMRSLEVSMLFIAMVNKQKKESKTKTTRTIKTPSSPAAIRGTMSLLK